MNKYQVTGNFFMDEAFMDTVPEHRLYINALIEQNIIEHYIVSMETHQTWITINAIDKDAVNKLLKDMPLAKYMKYAIAQVFVFDGASYRPTGFVLN